ncbi:hypothetical protein PW5551_06530 [Petrotoga sp. 9PW.55.5.1]|uniref:glycosyltransferase n=1 Tax=Petrotoga sp. 9PW.55.5.1 TaxID=1308979 RepID=UPI000DC47880|nr:glycosyltransferase [Petrotoga sp. 9PW.55.5.1]RAO99007.1 hypothetical protein PW5551_06530 [Petrotoga sp. 9PW.55.5.1]
MKKVLYIGNFDFPNNNAAGKRVYSNGKILEELGYKVIFVGLDRNLNGEIPLKETENIYDGFIYYNFPYPRSNLDWLNYRKNLNSLIDLFFIEEMGKDVQIVIYYGSLSLSIFIKKLMRFCRKHQINLIADCTDRLTIKTNNLALNFVKGIDETYLKTYLNKKADGIITVSNYLANYYKNAGCKTVIIPPLSPNKYTISDIDFNLEDKKVISYAGIPFRKNQKDMDPSTFKDRIDKMIMLLHIAKKRGCKFVFNVFGLTQNEYLYAIPSHGKIIDELGESICFHGLTTNEEAIKNIRKSDFTFLVRDVKRDTLAGFPTKVSESISCGTPVITNRTSDLENYVIEGKNGFFIDTLAGEIDENKFIEIMNLDKEKIIFMKNYCINNNIFYYKEYKDKMADFLNEVLSNGN